MTFNLNLMLMSQFEKVHIGIQVWLDRFCVKKFANFALTSSTKLFSALLKLCLSCIKVNI